MERRVRWASSVDVKENLDKLKEKSNFEKYSKFKSKESGDADTYQNQSDGKKNKKVEGQDIEIWWMDYCCKIICNFFKKFLFCISFGFLFSEYYRHKKEDDFEREDWLMNGEMDEPFIPYIKWDYKNCELYLNRRTTKKLNHQVQTRKAEARNRLKFDARALDQFYSHLRKDQLKDISLIVGPYEFLAHSYVLSAQSGVFRRQLFVGGAGSVSGHKSLLVPGINARQMESILVYIYCRTWPIYCMKGRRLKPEFIALLKRFEISMSMQKGKRQFCDEDPEEILQDAVIFTLNDEITQEKPEIKEVLKKAVQPKSSKVRTDNPWEFPQGFTYNATDRSFFQSNDFQRNEDLEQKIKDAKEFLKEFQGLSCIRTSSKASATSNWIQRNQH